MADVLINYSLELQPGEKLAIYTSAEANELNLALYEKALKAGAFPTILCDIPGRKEAFFKHANDEQLSQPNEIFLYVVKNFDAFLDIEATSNTRGLNNVAPEKLTHYAKANKDIMKEWVQRSSSGEFRWCATRFPTDGSAQEAKMATSDYVDFVYNACRLNTLNPVASWQEELLKQQKLTKWLEGKNEVNIKGTNVNLTMSIKGRQFMTAAGKLNFPDGEIYCSPVENSTNGWIKFTYPVIIGGREIQDLELWIKNGKVQKIKAEKGEELFASILETDEGAKVIGELGIGTNYEINQFTNDILFDEKIGGTIHLAIGQGFQECGGVNESSIHIDLVCNMNDGEIIVDSTVFYKNGAFNDSLLENK